MSALEWVAAAVAAAGGALSAMRWLRVAQREHYLAGSCLRFARMWWWDLRENRAFGALGLLGLLGVALGGLPKLTAPPRSAGHLSEIALAAGLVAIGVVVGAGPHGLGIRGRSAGLVWTSRMQRLGAVASIVAAALVAAGAAVSVRLGAVVLAVVALGMPLVVDLACLLTAPLERALAGRYVAMATKRLSEVAPTVVAITGSYGKTSTKNHVRDLVAGTRRVVASPASFNNRAGLARAVNEHLEDATEVFVAEMGTYGPGEIADLCAWCRPTVAVITAIGPVHLERFGSEDAILAAKSEIAHRAETVVLNAEDGRLAGLADRLEADGRRVVRVGTDPHSADAAVVLSGDGGVEVWLRGERIVSDVVLASSVAPTNLAAAVAVADALGVAAGAIAERVGALAPVDHRLSTGVAQAGFAVIDDTYNSNPAGARHALGALGATPVGPGGRRVVVTPGMVELGPAQPEENARFAEEAAHVADAVVVVGRTNAAALHRGLDAARSAGSGVEEHDAPDRRRAVEWVRSRFGPGDAVLYENDLPDHYP